jgi:hypothetical protein
MRKEIGATRDEVLWEMPLPELNLMLHAYYHMEGRDTPQTRNDTPKSVI